MKKLRLLCRAAGWSFVVALTVGMIPSLGLAQVQAPIFDPILGPPVRIISPPNHDVFYSPVDIPILAYTRSEVDFTNVEFYANGMDLGSGTKLSATNQPVCSTLASPDVMSPVTLGRLGSLWGLVWSNPPAGAYALTAVASGNLVAEPLTTTGISRTSAPVNITILTSTNGTNLLDVDVVSIVATDPIAIAGTNSCWAWPGMTNAVPAWADWPPSQWEYFTNWGPKAGLFTVRRFGDVSSVLNVFYNIGGTASNGVDYVALPGYVEFRAGCARALIPIIPIDNGSNNVPKTVILTLARPPYALVDYIIGFPRRAEVIILYQWPLPVPLLLPDGSFQLNANGPDGAWFYIQNSTDLVNWSSVCTNQVIEGSMDYIDPNAPGSPAGFYRALPLTNLPPQ
jgi:hypothetical protein